MQLPILGCSSDVILGLLDRDAPEHTIVAADQQPGARFGTGPWEAPLGGLWFTTLWRPHLSWAETPLLALAAAWAVYEGIRRQTGIATRLKWPNDVLVGDRKVASVRAEGRVDAGTVVGVAIGVGINVNNHPQDLPLEISGRATSLSRELGREVALNPLLDDVAAALREARAMLGRPHDLVEAFTGVWSQLDQPVAIDIGHRLLKGHAARIDPDGALVVRTEHGPVRVDDPALAKFVWVL